MWSAAISRTGIAFLNCEINIQGPRFAGDTIHVQGKVVQIKPASKGNRALVRTENQVINQKGEVTLTYNPLRTPPFSILTDDNQNGRKEEFNSSIKESRNVP